MRSATNVKTGFCALCRSRCGAQFEVKGDTLVAAHPEPAHPTGAALCTKGRAAPEIWANPNRLMHPMRRTTPKGSADPGWERISWDQALDEIAKRLTDIRKTHGAEQTVFAMTTSSGTPISDSNEWIDRFIRTYGSPNTINGIEICNWHKDYMQQLTNGSGVMYPDYVNTDLIFLWGFNPSATWLDQATQIATARARGAKVISIDPRRAGFAGSATQWLRVRPGSDGTLAMGMINALVAMGGHDEAFLRRWTSASLLVRGDTGSFLRAADLGLQETPNAYVAWNGTPVLYDAASRQFGADVGNLTLRGTVNIFTVDGPIVCRPAFDLLMAEAARYTPGRIKAETGITPDDLAAATRLLAEADSVAYYCWSGLGQHTNASQTDRAVALLMSLKGCHDAPGGNVSFTKVPSNPPGGPRPTNAAQLAKAIGSVDRPLGPGQLGWVRGPDVYDAILDHHPYPVRALVSFGANMVLSQGDGHRAAEALTALDFHVHCDLLESPTASFADILLPVNTLWEREGLRIGFEISQEAESLVQLRQRMVPSRGESRSDADIVFDLATRMGFDDAFFGGDFDRARDWQLAPSGLSVDMLRDRPEGITVPQVQRYRKYAENVENGRRGFATETGLIEIYSEPLLHIGQSPLPTFSAPTNDPRFPLVLTTSKSPYFCHSQYRDIPSLRRRHPHPKATVNPDTAANLGLLDSETVELVTDQGVVRMTLATDAALANDVVLADYGWWQANAALDLPGYDPLSASGANYNKLVTAQGSDPISGSVAHRALPCALRAVAATKLAWSGFRKARVATIKPEADDCIRLDFTVEGFEILPDYEPGQHIVLRLPVAGNIETLTRCYSLVGSALDSERRHYSITVRRVLSPADHPDLAPGRASGQIHDGLTLGDPVELMAPKGNFVLPLEGNAPLVLIAGGIGITPFLSYLETLAATGSTRRVHLTYANRNSAGHAYAARLQHIATKLPGLSIRTLYSAALPADRQGRDYDREGMIEESDIIPDEITISNAEFYHCGPPPMMQSVEQILAGRGISKDRIFSEAFGPSTSASDAANLPEGPFIVTLARSGHQIEWQRAFGSLLDAADKAKVRLASGCRVGQCESCAVRVLGGRVRHFNGNAGDSDVQCLTCSAVPLCDVVLDA